MILHLVLFTPRPDLQSSEREALAAALDRALETIPAVRTYRLGRRVRIGAAYDEAEPQDFQYCGLIEFEDRAGLETYLTHPAHADLGRLFHVTSERTLVHDFELADGPASGSIARWESGF